MTSQPDMASALTPEEPLLPREVYALLASANLLRIRGCWDDAVEKCMAAMRLAPNSSSAQSLLGDIYENQGRLDDAIQWYHMALDINPDSPADKIKLERATALAGLPPRTLPRLASLPKRAGSLHVSVRQRFAQTNPERALRFAALGMAALVVSVILFSLAVTHHRLSLLGLGTDTVVKTAPVVVPAPPPTGEETSLTHDPSEATLLNSLQADPILTAQGITVNDVQWDPRTSRITLTVGFSIPSPTRAAVLQNAMRALQEAAQTTDPSVTNVLTIRCLLVSGTSTSLAFVGDIPRSAVLVSGTDPAGLPFAQLLGSFSGVWWSPQVNP